MRKSTMIVIALAVLLAIISAIIYAISILLASVPVNINIHVEHVEVKLGFVDLLSIILVGRVVLNAFSYFV